MPFLKAAGLNESVAEAALKLVQSFVEGMTSMIYDYQWFRPHLVLRHLLKGNKLRANIRVCWRPSL